MEDFSVKDGIEVQTKHLAEWAEVLKPEVHEQLTKWAHAGNDRAKDGYSVRRGNDLIDWVLNYKHDRHILCS